MYTDEILPEELEKFVCIRISKIMGDYSIHWKGANRKGDIKSQMCTRINTSVAQEKAKTRSLIKVVLLDAKSGWRRCRKGLKYPTTCNERRRALGHFLDCEPVLAALCWRTRACRQCPPSPRTSRRRTCPASRGFARSSSPTRPVPWFDGVFPFPSHHWKNTSASSPKVLASPLILDPHPGREMGSKVIFLD